jgi:hypothetical protein
MKSATPQDTQDHILGAGALSFDWWLKADTKNFDTPEWECTITGGEGDSDDKTVVVNHAAVMKAARAILKKSPPYVTSALIRECRNLVFNVDECDFDANSADELLQVVVFGEVIYG